MLTNLFLALAINLAVIGFAATTGLPLWLSVLSDVGGLLVVLANSLWPLAWRVGDAPMVAGKCYDVKIDLAADEMKLEIIVAAQNGVNDYIVMTEHTPREFAAGDALTRVPSGARVPATETALILIEALYLEGVSLFSNAKKTRWPG